MNPREHLIRAFALSLFVVSCPALADADAVKESATTVSVTGYYYAMRDQPDFGVGVAAVDHGSLRVEARYNYEGHNVGSAFIGWKFAAGDQLAFAVTPIVGALFGAGRGAVPGFEASIAYGSVDAYIEAEYVHDRNQGSSRYYYAWSELGWKPVEWLRLGLVGQRTRVVDTGRDLQRGVFVQLSIKAATVGVYAFNPDSGSRYLIVSAGAQF
jgi:hypothetical protein